MINGGFLKWLRVNFWSFLLAIFSTILFVFLILPSLMRLNIVKVFLDFVLANSRNIKLIFAISSILQIVFVSFEEKLSQFFRRYINSIRIGLISSRAIISIVVFILFSTLLIKGYEPQYKVVLSVSWKCFILFICNISGLIVLWSIYNFIGWLWSLVHSNYTPMFRFNQFNAETLTDDPIFSQSEDLLDRGKFIDDVHKEIIYLSSESSFVFGLYGSWGEGKTSVLNLLKQKFFGMRNFLLIDFNPWYFNDKESILKGFYTQLERALSRNFVLPGEFLRNIRKYMQYISFGTNFGFNMSLSNANESIEVMKQNIGEYLETTELRLLVFIDDIDRLQADEVLQVFSIIKNSADLKNIIFVLSFDNEVIEGILQKELHSDRQFLDKIVQMPINLPKIPSENIGNYLIDNIEELLHKMNVPDYKKESFYKEFLPTYRAYISKFITTLRHVKRYINGLSATFPAIKSEVNLNDFFVLEAIRTFFPSFYNDIWNNRSFYIRVGWEEDPSQFWKKREEISSAVKEHVESTLKEAVGDDKEQGEILLMLLKKLFPVKVKNAFEQSYTDYNYTMDTFRAEQRLTHPESFVKYFMMKVPSSEISDETIEKIIDLWKSSKKEEKENNIKDTFFKFQSTKALKELFKKLRIFMDRIDEDLAIYIIKGIYKNTKKFSKEETEDSGNSEYNEALAALLWLVNDKVSKKKIEGILEEIVKLTPSIPFAVELVWSCKKGRDGSFYNIYESIKFGKLVDIISRHLKKYFIEGKRDIFSELPEEGDWSLVLYQWASRWATFRGKNKDTVSNYIVSIVRNDVKKFAKFVIHQRRRAQNDKMVFDLDELRKVYNLEAFSKLAEKFKKSSDLSDEERDILKQFLELYKKGLPSS